MKKDFFSFSQLNGEYPELCEHIRCGTPTAVFGISQPHKYLIASMIDAPIVYITSDAVASRKAAENLATLSGKQVELLSAKDEALLYRKALSKDAFYRRLNGIHALQTGVPIVVAEIDALLQLFPQRLPTLDFIEGEELDFLSLPQKLTQMGYTRVSEVETKGSFALRGDILDIYPINCENPARVDFFGDTVEHIKPYDIVTGNRLHLVKSLSVLAATDVFVHNEEVATIKAKLAEGVKGFSSVEAYDRANTIADELGSALETGNADGYLMPLLKNTTDVFGVLPEGCVFVFDESKPLFDKLNAIYKEHEERFARLAEGGEAFPFAKAQLIAKERFMLGLDGIGKIALQTFAGNPLFFQPLAIYNLSATPITRYLNTTVGLFDDLSNWLRGGYRILLYCGEASRAAKMQELLFDAYLPATEVPESASEVKGVCVSSEYLENGLVIHECKLVIIGTGNLYTRAPDTKRIRRKRGNMFSAPEIGDYAVHETHGIGKIIGTTKIETTDGIKEYIALSYKGGDVLHVPVENMDVLSKYVGDDSPTLSKIGGADFERVKARVRASLKKLAFDLKQLYAERSETKGYAFPYNETFMAEFEDAFKYDLTPDQASSVEEIKADMVSDKVMDRLLCGDVGFGKTEVALRAVYLCVLAGKQAALMCPSTVLCNQHYQTASERFEAFGVRVGVLSRFQTPREQEITLRDLADGKIDLLVGTHRLLSGDVKFKDLGLLVLDEEQRFGVEHKEKLKNLRKNIDCLTMTATPIPRTLHMSLSGIRDISTIQTPPSERLPVQTYVVEETDTLIRDACIREISRGGQVFILYNKVESIHTFAARVAAIVPEAEITVIHGRMDRNILEHSVHAFYGGLSNILITTTIIENGIDLPNANTIIVTDSDKLGISQLYQLRGRVGRGTRLAHAYFTYKAEKVMTENATARLQAIMQFTELGSGYKLAMRDLEIRGAGNVLGAEQHGHMDRVGYELYSKLLKEEMTGQREIPAELDIRVGAYISDRYIESSAGRLDAYKQIAEISTTADYKRVYESLRETYGELPIAVVNLLVIAVLKSYAQKLGVKKISVGDGVGALEFPSIDVLGDERIQAALDQFKSGVRLNMSSAPVLEFFGKKDSVDLMAEMTKFLKFALTFVNSP